jgi:hypothetical protein
MGGGAGRMAAGRVGRSTRVGNRRYVRGGWGGDYGCWPYTYTYNYPYPYCY